MSTQKKIIVIDDSQTVREQVQVAMRDTGFELIGAVDGVDELDTIRKIQTRRSSSAT